MAFPKSIPSAWVVRRLASAGKHVADLLPFEFGIFNEDTHAAIASGDVNKHRRVYMAVGSPNVKQFNQGSRFEQHLNILNADVPFKSEMMTTAAVDKIRVADPTREEKPNVYYLGYNGTNGCNSLKFECGRTYMFNVQVKGRPVRNVYGREMQEIIELETNCCDDCGTTNCGANCTQGADCHVYIDKLVERFNNSLWISRFYTAEKVLNCSPGLPELTKTYFNTYCLTVCDNGDEIALSNVQIAYPNANVTVKERQGSSTTYQLTQLASVAAPSAFQQANTVITNCDTCPTGYNKVSGFAYIVEIDNNNPLDPLLAVRSITNVTGGASWNTVTSATFVRYENGVSEYYVVAPAALGTPGIQEVSTTASGANWTGTSLVTGYTHTAGATTALTSAFTPVSGRVYNFTVEITGAGNTTLSAATFGGVDILPFLNSGGNGTYSFPVTTSNTNALVLTPASNYTGTIKVSIKDTTLGSDARIVQSLGVVEPRCVQASPSSTSWSLCGTGYKVSRDLVIVTKGDDCYAQELATTASGANWTGTSLIAGYTHTAGATTALTSAFTPVSGKQYRVNVEITGAGVTQLTAATMGGVNILTSVGTGANGTYSFTVTASNANALVLTPASGYTGTIKVSISLLAQGAADALAEVVAAYSTHPEVVSGSIAAVSTLVNTECLNKFKLSQYNTEVLTDGCDTYAVARFNEMPTFKGTRWTVEPCEGWTVDETSGCPVPPTPEERCCQCGVKFTGRPTTQILDEFDGYDIAEYLEKDPVEISVTVYRNDENTDVCDPANPTFFQAQRASFRQLRGDDVVKEIIRSRFYEKEIWLNQITKENQLILRREGIKLGVPDTQAFYYAVDIYHNVQNLMNNTASYSNTRERITLYIHEDDVAVKDLIAGQLAAAFPQAKIEGL